MLHPLVRKQSLQEFPFPPLGKSLNGDGNGNKVEHKTCRIKSTVEDEEKGILHAVVSVFGNEDSDGDVMVKGAFQSSIKASKQRDKFPPGVWHHIREQPVAKTLEMWEEDDGLHVKAQFNLETQIGKETYSNIKMGIIDEYSFGFRVLQADRKDGKRYITDVDMKEWSPVLWGANDQTRTVMVKEQKSIFGGIQEQLLASNIRQICDRFWRLGYELAYGDRDKNEALDYLNQTLDEFSMYMRAYCDAHLTLMDEIIVETVDAGDDSLYFADNQFTQVKEGKIVIYKDKLEEIAKNISDQDVELKSGISQVYSIVRLKTQDKTFLPPWLASDSSTSEVRTDEGKEGDQNSEVKTVESEDHNLKALNALVLNIELAEIEASLKSLRDGVTQKC